MSSRTKRANTSNDEKTGANKKVRTSTGPSATRKENESGNPYWELSAKRRVTVEEFKGKTLIAVREFYEKDGKTLPGKSGISLTPEQFWALLSVVPDIKKVLESKGEVENAQSDSEAKPSISNEEASDGNGD